MSAPLPILPPFPLGDGTKRANIKLRQGIGRIARRVAMAALASGTDDVFRDVYAAGISHAVSLIEERDAPST